MKSLVILISGRGSNMQALLKAKLHVDSIAVISNNPHATGLEIAEKQGVKTAIVDHRAYSDRDAFETALVEIIDSYQPKLIVLAGFMRILSSRFVQHYQGRIMNIHPSLLPAFPGLDTHTRALQEGIKIHGCTVHFVTSQLDHGPIIIQAAVPVLPNDSEKTLATRVLQQEHRIYPQAVRWFMEDRLKLSYNYVEVDETSFNQTVLYSPGLQE
ncbi:formyltetrahydrofolate-dependent phosphoribosylglycinamide formyltransferase [Nitrosomonas cryotolerans]|uniref:Phosphoribosylglycinamide formyltransferase n=1 Tax=Nitrosomonas cryotolerans ATCC 49181 TaxID=1131553 RepID=A0A1N6JDJ3_9PROT|nr:phosphoribosylglycinamide formyltransferase [Nitrosomonas cryotolerans]SFP49378.1 formyltetrahydrofolate-dependent phosphoribosylglycinamide formyltransferase [Nitrosomonas cryotolerans]SIO42281.1 formyltetrahydrofolate-dependent phosphoribosylglycinamide formyltransferase [Nitrosomonas cryotolerans ATCC 49181]